MAERKRILYVDDDADMREILQVVLEDEADFELELCASGREALDFVGSYRPDLVLLDVLMPEMDGPTTFRRMRAHPAFGETPVAFVTAGVEPQEVAQLHALGARDVIAKPFDPMTIADRIRAVDLGNCGR